MTGRVGAEFILQKSYGKSKLRSSGYVFVHVCSDRGQVLKPGFFLCSSGINTADHDGLNDLRWIFDRYLGTHLHNHRKIIMF